MNPLQSLIAYLQSLGQQQQVISPLGQGMATPSLTQGQYALQQAPMRTTFQKPTASPTPTPYPNFGPTSFSHFTTSQVPQNLAPIIYKSAQQYGVDPNVFASLLFSEHGFQADNKRNYNTDGTYDRGIAQINSGAHPEVTDQQAIDPNFAIPWAAKTLGGHIKNLGLQRGIVAYNTGENGAMQVATPSAHPYYKKVTQGLSQDLRGSLGL